MGHFVIIYTLEYYEESLERPEKTMFLRFEELKAEPVKVLKDLEF